MKSFKNLKRFYLKSFVNLAKITSQYLFSLNNYTGLAEIGKNFLQNS